jgi:hypothetical protein
MAWDSLSKATQYRHLAAECVKLAELANSDKVREHYHKIAASYLAMARAEIRHAEHEAIRRHDPASHK